MIRCPFVLVTTLLMLGLLLGTAPSLLWANDCFECHVRADFDGRRVHAPLTSDQCSACHSPHATRHEGLLWQPQKVLCFGCHASLQQQIAARKSTHAPVLKADCTACHAPHASEHRNLLSGSLSQSCLVCHTDFADSFSVRHAPYARGECDVCHDPHAADDDRLIKASDPQLCLSCHRQTDHLRTTHMGRSPTSMECLGCHNPHGSSQQSLLRSRLHDPFAAGNCQVCHAATRKDMTMCIQCHADVLETFHHAGNHLLGAGANNFCINCHSPHASDQAGLMPGAPGDVCRDCHADTFRRRQQMVHRHPGWESCASCHGVHGSDFPTMLKDEPDKVCTGCHGRHTTFVHPIGEAAIDPRNGRPMTCLTCHDPNVGSMFKFNLRGSGDRGLCVICHRGY